MALDGRSDVIIIGAGPSGCAAGITLARAGFDVAVFDAATFPRDKVCGDALSPEAVRLVERLGASEAIRSSPHAAYQRGAAIFPDGTRIERTHRHAGYIVPRLSLDGGLLVALRGAGARVFEGQRITALEHDDGVVRGVRGPGLPWSARLVIATDGYASLAARHVGAGRLPSSTVAVSATAYFRGVRFPHGNDVTEHFFEPELARGYAWIFPPVDGLSNVGVYMRADSYAEHGRKLPELLDLFVTRHRDRFDGAQRAGEIRSWPLPLSPRRQPLSAPGVILAGDAAGLVDPLSGEGIWQALSSGVLAGSTAREALRIGSLTPELRGRYQRDCARAFERPSRRKLWIQTVNEHVMRAELYRRPWLRALLRWGWGHRLFDSQQQPLTRPVS